MSDPDLRAHLIGRGATDAEIAGLDDSGLIGLAGDLRLAEGLTLAVDEIADRCGTSVERVRSIYGALGLDVETLPGFGEADLRLVGLVVSDESGIVDQVAGELLRVAGMSMRRLAEATVAAYVQDVENHPARMGADLVALAELNDRASGLVVELSETLGAMFRHHMWMAVRGQRTGQHGVDSPELIRAGIGFVDLVGYTPISHHLEPNALMALVDDFEQRAFDVARHHGGRIVKSIGDEVMIAAHDHDTVIAIAQALISEFGGQSGNRPRGGVSAGEVVFRLGDYYGPVVNAAARLVATADPGEILTDTREQASRFSLQPVGRRELKGFDRPVEVWSIR